MRFTSKKYPLLLKSNFLNPTVNDWIFNNESCENFKARDKTIIASLISACMKDFREKRPILGYVSDVFYQEASKNQDKLRVYVEDFFREKYFFVHKGGIWVGEIGHWGAILANNSVQCFRWVEEDDKGNAQVYFFGNKDHVSNLDKQHADCSGWPITVYLFRKFAETTTKVLPAKKTIKDFHCKYKSDLDIDIELLTENWYTESCQNHPFIVRGHWRMQACGPARKERRLKWIDAFWKEGYKKGAYMEQNV